MIIRLFQIKSTIDVFIEISWIEDPWLPIYLAQVLLIIQYDRVIYLSAVPGEYQ